jgi:hypothetical protein
MALKPVTLDDSTICFSAFDPALDLEKSNLDGYNETWLKKPNDYMEYLKVKDGQQLTKFVIGVVPSAEFVRIMDECQISKSGMSHNQEFWWRCFINGIRSIENWQGEKPKTKMIGSVEYVDPTWLASVFNRGMRRTAIDIGMHVLAFNSVTDEEIKN